MHVLKEPQGKAGGNLSGGKSTFITDAGSAADSTAAEAGYISTSSQRNVAV
ncbi:hypothetical protein P3T18_000947 [Paraburkholderia sp. GAS199]